MDAVFTATFVAVPEPTSFVRDRSEPHVCCCDVALITHAERSPARLSPRAARAAGIRLSPASRATLSQRPDGRPDRRGVRSGRRPSCLNIDRDHRFDVRVFCVRQFISRGFATAASLLRAQTRGPCHGRGHTISIRADAGTGCSCPSQTKRGACQTRHRSTRKFGNLLSSTSQDGTINVLLTFAAFAITACMSLCNLLEDAKQTTTLLGVACAGAAAITAVGLDRLVNQHPASRQSCCFSPGVILRAIGTVVCGAELSKLEASLMTSMSRRPSMRPSYTGPPYPRRTNGWNGETLRNVSSMVGNALLERKVATQRPGEICFHPV